MIRLEDVEVRPLRDNCFRISFVTSRGTNRAVLHHLEGNAAGTVLVGGAGGGLDGPASIYPKMGPDLLDRGISSLRLDYRMKNDLEECILDTLLGIEFLRSLEMHRVGLVGWSFGGAVVIGAGVINDIVRAVVTVASQTYGTGIVGELSPKALLLIHGTGDRTLPFQLSEDIYRRAGEPKEILLYKDANHGVDEYEPEMRGEIERFLEKHLRHFK